MKRGRGMCGTVKAFNLMYLHVLRAGMVYLAIWYVHAPVRSRTKLYRTDHLKIQFCYTIFT